MAHESYDKKSKNDRLNLSALNQEVAEINNDMFPDDGSNIFAREEESNFGDATMQKTHKMLLQPPSENSSPEPVKGVTNVAPKVYVVSETSSNVVVVKKSPPKPVSNKFENIQRITEEYPAQRTEGTEEVMIIEESEEEVTLGDDLPFHT